MSYGPKMRLLTERQRAFVEAYVNMGNENASEAYRRAGYSTNSEGSVRVEAHRMVHNPKIQAAIIEQTSNRLYAFAPVALRRMMQMATDPNNRDTFAATKHILGAIGFGSKQTIEVNHAGQVEMSFAEVRAQIEALKRAGIQQLPSPVMIEHNPEEEFEPS